jgi:hypothetical protein
LVGVRWFFSSDETSPFFGFLVAVLEEERFTIGVSTLYYTVATRDLYPSASLASWMYFTGYVVAGSMAFVSVVPRDSFWRRVLQGVGVLPERNGRRVLGFSVQWLDSRRAPQPRVRAHSCRGLLGPGLWG